MKFGIIGGNGVAATNRLLNMVEQKITTGGAFRDQHHPEMIIWQATQAPSRSMYLEGRGPSFVEDYVRIAEEFKRLGVNAVCMCCNTAHYCVNDIELGSGIEFINLLEIVAKRAKASGKMEFELFVTDGARKFKLYDAAFERVFPEAKLIYPNETRQAKVTSVIAGVKTNRRFLSRDDKDNPRSVIRELVKTAEYPVIFGCTDIRIAYMDGEMLDDGVILDSLECLADEIVVRSNCNGH